MGENPPYLFPPAPGPVRAKLTVTTDVDGSVIDIVVRGQWTARLGAQVQRTIGKCLAESPAAIVFDTTELDDAEAASVPVWLSATQSAAVADPPARLALCLPPKSALADRLRRVGTDRYLPVFTEPADARVALAGNRPLTDVVRARLPAAPASPGVARNLIGGACHTWNLGALLHPGRAVMSELVANAVEHAGTEMEVSISRRGTALHLAVRDRDPTLPRVLDLAPAEPGRPLDERGHGLRVVHADSVAWGAIPTAGGKVVWATVRGRTDHRRTW